MATAHSLAILTRPAGRNALLCRDLLSRHWTVLECPALDIHEQVTQEMAVPQTAAFDVVVFVSRAAVNGYRRLLAGENPFTWPSQTACACVGPATADAIRQTFGQSVPVLYPDSEHTQDSEALLPLLLAMRPAPKKVLIVRGQNGREWLKEQLLERGIEVSVCQSYYRQVAQWSEVLTDQLLSFKQKGTRATWLLTSAQGVEALHTKLAALDLLDWFSQGQFVLTHERVKTALFTHLTRPIASEDFLIAQPENLSILDSFERLRSIETLKSR